MSNCFARSFNSLLEFPTTWMESRLDWDLEGWAIAFWTWGGKSLLSWLMTRSILRIFQTHGRCFNQYHKHQMDTHHRDPMGDYSHNHARDTWHIDYRIHSIIEVHNLHFLSWIVWEKVINPFKTRNGSVVWLSGEYWNSVGISYEMVIFP